MKASAEYLRQVLRHVFSDEDLEATLGVLRSFEFHLLKNHDLKTRKKALLCLFLLLGRPRLPCFASRTLKGSAKANLMKNKPAIFLPAIQREDRIFLMLGSITEEDILFQLDASKTIRPASLMLVSHLFVYCQDPSTITATTGAAEISMLTGESSCDAFTAQVPDPLKVKVFAPLSPAWTGIANFSYMRIGGGEEDLPSCSTSVSESRASSVESFREPLYTGSKDAAGTTKPSISELSHKLQSTSTAQKKVVQTISILSVPKNTVGIQKASTKSHIPSVEIRPKKLSNNFRLKLVNPEFLSGNTLSPGPEKNTEKSSHVKVATQSPKKTNSFVINNFALKKCNSTVGLKTRPAKIEISVSNKSQTVMNPTPIQASLTARASLRASTYQSPAKGLTSKPMQTSSRIK